MRLWSIVLFILITFGCSRGSGEKTQGKFNFTGLHAITSSSLQGGVFVKCVNNDPGALEQNIILKLDENDEALIPYGNWDFYVVGFVGPTVASGNDHCDSSLGVELGAPSAQVELTLQESNCDAADFAAIVTEIKTFAQGGAAANTWGAATWGSSTWGP
jgi:hypothetical protein